MANTTGKKFRGREKGTPNKLTRELRSVLVKLLPYVLPKLSPASHNTDEPLTIEW